CILRRPATCPMMNKGTLGKACITWGGVRFINKIKTKPPANPTRLKPRINDKAGSNRRKTNNNKPEAKTRINKGGMKVVTANHSLFQSIFAKPEKNVFMTSKLWRK